MNITLIGMPGSGKSTVGVVLAKLRGMDFVDADLVIQRREKMRLQQILDSRGLDAFLDAEQAAICSITQDHTVIAPGGSVIARQASMEHLRKQGPVVYLRLPLEELEMRLGDIATRGIALEAGQTLENLYTVRTPIYEAYADLIVDCGGNHPIAQTAQQVSRQVDALPAKKRKNALTGFQSGRFFNRAKHATPKRNSVRQIQRRWTWPPSQHMVGGCWAHNRDHIPDPVCVGLK